MRLPGQSCALQKVSVAVWSHWVGMHEAGKVLGTLTFVGEKLFFPLQKDEDLNTMISIFVLDTFCVLFSRGGWIVTGKITTSSPCSHLFSQLLFSVWRKEVWMQSITIVNYTLQFSMLGKSKVQHAPSAKLRLDFIAALGSQRGGWTAAMSVRSWPQPGHLYTP